MDAPIERKSLVIGTAGHIDHGKSSLVKALTGIDPDRLKEEKERGITIDLGFAKLLLPSGIFVSIVDVPGHERFIRNMVAGASGIDLVLLVIAADEGIKPQTKEHLEICELLGIKDGIVVLTKVDLVDKEWLELIKMEVEEYLKETFLKNSPIIPFSAVTLEGKEELIQVLDEKAQELSFKDKSLPFRLPIDSAFNIKGYGLVVRGTALSGEVSLNQELMLYPHKIKIKVRNIQVHGKNMEKASAGSRIALNIQGVEKEKIKRGDIVAEPEVLEPSQWLDLKVKILKEIEPPLKNLENLLFYVGTSEVLGKIVLFNKETLFPKEEDVAQIFLQYHVCVWRGDRFILRRPGTNQTIGGGIILNPLSQRRKRTKPWERKELEFLAQAQEKDLVNFYIQKKGAQGIAFKNLGLYTGLFGERLQKILSHLEIIQKKYKDTFYLFSKEAFKNLKEEIKEKFKKFHQNTPFALGLTKEFLRNRLSSLPHEILFDIALEELIKEKILQKEKEIYYLEEFKKELTDIETVKKQIEEKFLKEELTPRNYEEILFELGKDYKVYEEILKGLLREGILIKLTEKIIVHRRMIEEVISKVKDYFKKHKELTVADFKKLVGEGVSRKYLIPLLEYLDRQKITLRIGDKRVFRKS